MGGYGEFEALVGHLAFVAGDCAGSGGAGRKGHVHEHVGGLLVIPVGRECQSAAQHGEVYADVGLGCCLPGEVGCAQVGLCYGRDGVRLAFLEPFDAVDIVALEIGVVADARLVTGLSPAGAQLEVVDPLDVAQEAFLRNAPGCRERGEDTPAVVGMELR